MRRNSFNFEEAIRLFEIGVYGFVFHNHDGDQFTSSLDELGDLMIIPTTANKEVSTIILKKRDY